MAIFEAVKKYPNAELPERKTADSAGYDFVVAEDTLVPPYQYLMTEIVSLAGLGAIDDPVTLEEMATITKHAHAKPTLVPTGVKCKMAPDEYLDITPRSSTPLKYWLFIANSPSRIDADYYNNSENEGHIYMQVVNFSPLPIILKRGDRIAQGIIHKYMKTEDDTASGIRDGGFGSTKNQ